ncbi:MAG TPA: carbon storage regulator [Gemmataceae bacterium]|nr:carbon storage regulator [Gemmataceae bacterium]
MLILSRKIGERLIIGGDIVITVAEIQRGRVRLGIEAPAEIIVVREELQMRVPSAQPATIGGGAGR